MSVVYLSVPQAIEVLSDQLDLADAAVAVAIQSHSPVAVIEAANFHLSVAKQISALDAAVFSLAA